MRKSYKIAFDARPAQGNNRNITGVATYSLNIIKNFSVLVEDFDFIFIIDSTLDSSHIAFPENSEFIYTSIGRGGGLRNWILRDYFTQIILPQKLISMGAHLYHQPDYIIPVRATPFVIVPTFLDAIVFTPHDHRSYLAKARDKYLLKKGANNADAIITISDFSKQELVKYLGIDPCKIVKIWIGISECFFSPVNKESAASCCRKLGFNGDFIFYYGGYGQRKNVKLLLDAFSIIRNRIDIKLVLAGNITKIIEDKIITLNLFESVKIFGFAKEEELKELLNMCSVFVFPSSMEGFGLPVAEAMACGAPVVCSDNGSLPEIAGSAAQYFERAEPKHLAFTIIKVLEDKYLREQLKYHSKLRARNFRWENLILELRNMYVSLIEKII